MEMKLNIMIILLTLIVLINFFFYISNNIHDAIEHAGFHKNY